MTVQAALNYDLDEETPVDPNVYVTCEESIDHAIRSASISKYISRVGAQHSRVVHRFPMLIQLHRFLSIMTLMKFPFLRKGSLLNPFLNHQQVNLDLLHPTSPILKMNLSRIMISATLVR